MTFTSITYVHDSPGHLCMPQLFTDCIACPWLLCIWLNIYVSVLRCSTEMSWD